MKNKTTKRSEEAQKQNEQPGNLSSFNNRDTTRNAEVEDAEKEMRDKNKNSGNENQTKADKSK